MQSPDRSTSLAVATALAVLMTATRFGHAGDALHLPDASMAVFFLGGLYLRRHLAFALLVALAVMIDWAAISLAGVSDFCVTPAYAFLPLAYAALWYAGRAYAPRLAAAPAALAGAFGVALLAAALSFAISNGAFYWLGGRYVHPHPGEYLARLWQWGPPFVRTTLAYVAAGLAVHAALARLRAWRRREVRA
ncbi:hypothetical protein QMK61_02755 [Fulvimonas sp. R45]|uniref:hypothetical protein n=1 Tax=Fulvimonas sp. R45 TaxID=3045937 RepID=UPI00265E0987|nr:hypothetical protein [Fulvimonas sp. R45]MDO1527741.1 hypothetical protein [Fulvimonas sp. R45]